MKRTAMPPGKPLTRKTVISPRNRKRREAKHARNFGDEADAVRAMPCLCRARETVVRCCGATVDAHVKSRGAGGGRFDVVPLCWWHHNEQHVVGVATFTERYGLDLRAEADRIALEHAAPLGLRGVARRWKAMRAAIDDPSIRHDSPEFAARLDQLLDAYESAALFGWARRRMEREAERRRGRRCEVLGLGPDLSDRVEYDVDREALAHTVLLDLGEPYTSDPSGEHGLATWALCEVAGWPEVDRG